MIDRRELAKKITLLESNRPEDAQAIWSLLEEASESNSRSIILGVFGSPGVGKSTFISAFAHQMTKQRDNLQIAILTIDPTSPISGGSLLGDKTRMQNLLGNPNIYIRPSPSGTGAGAIAPMTAETCMLLASYGFDYIIIETVGSGQNDIEVSKIADFNFLLIQPSEGDFVQGLKKGALEVADYILVTKADGALKTLAEATASDYQSSLEFSLHQERKRNVATISSVDGTGIAKLCNSVLDEINDERITTGQAKRRLYLTEKLLRKKIIEELDSNKEMEKFLKSLNKSSNKNLNESLKKISKLEINFKLKS